MHEQSRPVRCHLRRITAEMPAPAKAQGSEQVCGTFILTGQVKCVAAGSPKANFIEDIPIP